MPIYTYCYIGAGILVLVPADAKLKFETCDRRGAARLIRQGARVAR